MSALRRVFSMVHRRSNSSPPTPTTNERAPNGVPTASNLHCRTSVDVPNTTNGLSASDSEEHQPSVAEQKDHHKKEREAKDEQESDARGSKQKLLRDYDPLRQNYGDVPDMFPEDSESQPHTGRHLDSLSSIALKSPGDIVRFRARVHHIRPLGSKIVFIILRHQITTVQAVLTEEHDIVSQNMVRWAEGLDRETIVLVEGIVETPPKNQREIKSATVHRLEVKVLKLYVVAAPTSPLPFQVEDEVRLMYKFGKTTESRTPAVGDRTRLDNRVLDLRTPTSQAIFRIRAGVCALFRAALTERGFLEIQSSKLQGSSTESGASVFKVDYFRRPAFLAQSPQLAKQMCIAADMERVFEIGPVFRAENSNTHRHLTEFTGLDLEMAFERDYHEVLDTIDETLLYIFRGLQEIFREEIETVKKQYPHEDLVFLDKTLRLTFADGIQLLKESGWREADGSVPSEWEDLSTKGEQRLGQLVKEKYGTDYYILDKFPAKVRPFYTMPDPKAEGLSNSFDIFLRGEEILSGGQRIHQAPQLEKRMREVGVDPDTMKEYVDGFRWGCPPHGGGGVGLERVVMLFLKLGNVRWANLFPRDPRSFPMNGQCLAEASMNAAAGLILRGPESSTLEPGINHGELPPLENLIAKYGDATNTSWIDPAWTVWRDKATGAAVGYIEERGFAVTFGNPLCESRQIPRVVKAYREFLQAKDLKPVWCCLSKDVGRYLADDLGWSVVIAVAEERLNPTEVDPASNDKTARRKIHHAEREGVNIIEVEGQVEASVRAEIEQKCKEWTARRRGKQIHLTSVRPFDDMVHRKYYYAVDKDGNICALVVLAQLSAAHGFQIKWALDFPGAPLGVIEYILSYVIRKLGDAGVRSATFGAGATRSLHRVANVSGLRVRTLEKTYNGLAHTFNLMTKGDFRSKFGIQPDPLYICYPRGSLGMKGIEAIMAVLEKPK